MKIYTKESLTQSLQEIANRGWIPNHRPNNCGGIGNTVEDLLDIPENNLPIPNANEWELKTHKYDSVALLTLFHSEPSPRAIKFVPNILLPHYGWEHKEAGRKYPSNERSFRQTFSGNKPTGRGFILKVDWDSRRVVVVFDPTKVSADNTEWLNKIGLQPLHPQPYWGFDDLGHQAGIKLLNTFYIFVEAKRENGQALFRIRNAYISEKFSFDKFLEGIEAGNVYCDFDARTHHNHGTHFRVKENSMPFLYEKVMVIV